MTTIKYVYVQVELIHGAVRVLAFAINAPFTLNGCYGMTVNW